MHSVSYFLPDVAEQSGALGMRGRTPYFAARSAPMGAVGAGVDWARAAEILRGVTEAIPNADGRPLYAAHADLRWPQSPHSRLWHAITLLREYRGDGHIAALITYRLSGLEALITHTASEIGFTVEFARRLRGWTAEQWTAATDRLRQRGLLDESGALTIAGLQLRTEIEDLTDALAFDPWRTLPDGEAAELERFATSIREMVLNAGVFPAGAFAARYGQHR